MSQYFSFPYNGNIAILISTLLLQCQQLPWKMEPNITLALICNPVLPRAAHLTLPTSIPPGKTKHAAHWFCPTFGSLFFLNSYTFWFLRHQFSSLPNTSRPSAAFMFFWWWLTHSGGSAVTISPCLVGQIQTGSVSLVERILCCG